MARDIFLPPAKDLAALCGVDISTARRWRRRATCLPKSALIILTGDLGYLSPEWRGWRIRGSEIISPDGWTINRNDALIVPLMHGQIAALRADLRQARARIEELEAGPRLDEQPLPDQWSVEGF